MPDDPRRDRSPGDDGLYLVPYWVQGGRLWTLILAVLVGGGVILPFSAAWFGASCVLQGFWLRSGGQLLFVGQR